MIGMIHQLLVVAILLQPFSALSTITQSAPSKLSKNTSQFNVNGSQHNTAFNETDESNTEIIEQINRINKDIVRHDGRNTEVLLSKYSTSIDDQLRPCEFTQLNKIKSASYGDIDAIIFYGDINPIDRWVLQYNHTTGELLSTSEISFDANSDFLNVRISKDKVVLAEKSVVLSQSDVAKFGLDECDGKSGWDCFSCCMEEQFDISTTVITLMAMACSAACLSAPVTLGIACYLCLLTAAMAYGFEIGFCYGYCE